MNVIDAIIEHTRTTDPEALAELEHEALACFPVAQTGAPALRMLIRYAAFPTATFHAKWREMRRNAGPQLPPVARTVIESFCEALRQGDYRADYIDSQGIKRDLSELIARAPHVWPALHRGIASGLCIGTSEFEYVEIRHAEAERQHTSSESKTPRPVRLKAKRDIQYAKKLIDTKKAGSEREAARLAAEKALADGRIVVTQLGSRTDYVRTVLRADHRKIASSKS